MKVIDIRLVVEDDANSQSLLSEMVDNMPDVLGGTELRPNGFGHIHPNMEGIIFGVDEQERATYQQVRTRLEFGH